MEERKQTPSQTIGPFFAYGMTPEQYDYDFNSWFDGNMVKNGSTQDIITISGKVIDGEGEHIEDAMIEVWQNDINAQSFGRYGTGTSSDCRFTFKTTKPKAIDGAPFISVIVFMRGALLHLYTRIYFSDEAALNSSDPILNSVPAGRRHTLIAQKRGDMYEFNIYMQGEKETVFFDV